MYKVRSYASYMDWWFGRTANITKQQLNIIVCILHAFKKWWGGGLEPSGLIEVYAYGNSLFAIIRQANVKDLVGFRNCTKYAKRTLL